MTWPELEPILNQCSAFYTLERYFLDQFKETFHAAVGLSSDLLPTGLPTKHLCKFLISPMFYTSQVNSIVPNMIFLTIFGEIPYSKICHRPLFTSPFL
jgi:hypothetical protein